MKAVKGVGKTYHWGDVGSRPNGRGRLRVARANTGQEDRDAGPRLGKDTAAALLDIPPPEAKIAPSASVFGLSASQINRRIKPAAAAGLGQGYRDHSG